MLVLTAAGAVAAAASAPDTYQAATTVVLLTPSAPADKVTPLNPFLEFNASLNTTARAVADVMTSDQLVRRMVQKGAERTYAIGNGSEGPSPILNIVATGPTAATTTRTLEVVSQGIADQLVEIQRAVGAPQNTWIVSRTLSPPSDPIPQFGAKVRPVVGVAGAGTLGTFSLAILFESLSRRRGSRPPSKRGAGAPNDPSVAPEEPTRLGVTPGSPASEADKGEATAGDPADRIDDPGPGLRGTRSAEPGPGAPQPSSYPARL